jgi:hypothetical protein
LNFVRTSFADADIIIVVIDSDDSRIDIDWSWRYLYDGVRDSRSMSSSSDSSSLTRPLFAESVEGSISSCRVREGSRKCVRVEVHGES